MSKDEETPDKPTEEPRARSEAAKNRAPLREHA